jgi:hypothetical protein
VCRTSFKAYPSTSIKRPANDSRIVKPSRQAIAKIYPNSKSSPYQKLLQLQLYSNSKATSNPTLSPHITISNEPIVRCPHHICPQARSTRMTKRQPTSRACRQGKIASAGNRTRGWPNQEEFSMLNEEDTRCFSWQRPILPLNHQCFHEDLLQHLVISTITRSRISASLVLGKKEVCHANMLERCA